MQVITLIPIVRGIGKDELTYFSTLPVKVGDIATVTINSREVRGIVTDVLDARTAKNSVKRGDFALKKVLKIEPGFIAPSVISVAKETSDYFACSVSQVLGSMYPKNVLNEVESKKLPCLPAGRKVERNHPSPSGRGRGGVAIEGTRQDRFVWIQKNLIKRNMKVLYISPSNHELAKAKKVFNDTEIICVSPEYGFVWLPYVDTIILDNESGAGYHDNSRAQIDFKKVYEFHALENKQQIIFADNVLDLKYFANPKSGQHRVLTTFPKVMVVKKEKTALHNSWLVSKEAVGLTEKILAKNSRMFFFAPRKSIASITVCGDCGETVQCETCKRPLMLARKNGKRIFICQKCSQITQVDISCASCNSWKLRPLGVTVDSVADELERLFPKATVLRVSGDITKTKTQLAKIIKQFYATSGALLVGTELALPYLEQLISYSVISSIDSFLSGRSLSGTDKAARIIFEVATLAHEKVLVETSDPHQQFFQDISDGGGLTSAMLKTYREHELAERKKFNYPPYSIIIKINSEIFFINKEKWPDAELVARIRALPKGSTYTIDANSVV
ncbi:MAG: hypothetical protein WC764_04075 [Candidatus Paceibacterota bacterium]|jgi:primosomal protein N'